MCCFDIWWNWKGMSGPTDKFPSEHSDPLDKNPSPNNSPLSSGPGTVLDYPWVVYFNFLPATELFKQVKHFLPCKPVSTSVSYSSKACPWPLAVSSVPKCNPCVTLRSVCPLGCEYMWLVKAVKLICPMLDVLCLAILIGQNLFLTNVVKRKWSQHTPNNANNKW